MDHASDQRASSTWPVTLQEVLAALTVRDEVVVDSGATGRLVVRRETPEPRAPSVARAPDESDLPVLDALDEEVLRRVASGLSASAVAQVLGLTLPEVAARCRVIRGAFGVTSTAAAVEAAGHRRAGPVSPG